MKNEALAQSHRVTKWQCWDSNPGHVIRVQAVDHSNTLPLQMRNALGLTGLYLGSTIRDLILLKRPYEHHKNQFSQKIIK